MLNEYSEITELKGIGEKTAALFHKVGVYSLWDLMTYYPRDYESYDIPVSLDEAKKFAGQEKTVSVFLTIKSNPALRHVRNLKIISVYAEDKGTSIECIWFNMPYLKNTLHSGSSYIFRGVISQKNGGFVMKQPQIYKEEDYNHKTNSLQPVYSLTKGLTSQGITKMVSKAMKEVPHYKDYLDDDVHKSFRLEEQFMEMNEAIHTMHFPTQYERVISARRRLVFDEFFFFVLSVRMLREENRRQKNDYQMIESAACERLMEELPYQLTNAQLRTYHEIMKDMSGNYAMNRLVQGDVGSGKTIIAVLALITAGMNGYQGALMAPTEVLAAQHMESISNLLQDYHIPLKCVLLTGSMSAKDKRNAKEKILSGEASIVIGTHALIQDGITFSDLALVVTDEQHRFGVKQRENLASKSHKIPHVLVMSATPIPRTLAIIIYGDLDISIMDELPAERLPIKNCVVGQNFRPKAYQFIENEVKSGRQALIICPMVEESEQLEAENVVDYTRDLREYYKDRYVIEYLHGKMRSADKNQIMDRFASGEIEILVSTTVIEVGINVPNTTVIMIENSERFGLAQLHQLRGRVGRGKYQSYCIFMCGKDNKEIKERLDILNHSNDGFKIAEEDLKLRGPGDLFGFRQSGDMSFKIGDIYTDKEILKTAADYAAWLIEHGITKESKGYENLFLRLSMYQKNQFGHVNL